VLQKLKSILGFHTVIFEDREEYGNYERFTDVSEIILGDIEEGLRNYNIAEECYIIIVTRGHIHDEITLRSVINSKIKYGGMIKSKNKVAKLKKSLKDNYDINKINSIYTPIGIDLGGESPKEIALSIICEILKIKNKGTLIHIKDKVTLKNSNSVYQLFYTILCF